MSVTVAIGMWGFYVLIMWQTHVLSLGKVSVLNNMHENHWLCSPWTRETYSDIMEIPVEWQFLHFIGTNVIINSCFVAMASTTMFGT